MTQADVAMLNAAREASTMLADIANKRRNDSVFFGNGLVGDATTIVADGETSNFAKFVLYSLGGEFAEREGETPIKIHNVETSTQLVETSERLLAARVSRSLIRRLADGHKTEVEKRMNGIVDVWISDVDKRLTTLLAAGESTTDLLGDSFHSAAHTIAGSDETFLNLRTGTWVTSAATIKTAIMQMLADFEGMTNAHAGLINNPSDVEPVVVMYKGNDTNSIHEKIIDAVDASLLVASGGTNTLKGRVKIVNNPYLALDTSLYGFLRAGVDSALMYGEVGAGPELLTNAGNGSNQMDTDQMLNNRDTYIAQYDSAVMVGNPYHSIKRNNA